MALQSSGTISLSNVNVELLVSATATISMNDTNVRTLAGVASGAIAVSNFYSKSWRKTATYTFTTNTTDATVNISSISGYSAGITDAVIVVNSGVYVYTDNTGGYALTISGGTTGDTVKLTNNGFIQGRGGNGTQMDRTWYHEAGVAGGPAINLTTALSTVTIDNQSGYIGGGGGAGATTSVPYQTGCSGGGAGNGVGFRYDDGYGFQFGNTSIGPGQSGSGQQLGGISGGSGGRIMPGSGGGGGGNGNNFGGGAGGSGGGGGGSTNTTKAQGGFGGDGGSAGATGGKGRSSQQNNQGTGAGGGGGWGASGGNYATGRNGEYEYGSYGYAGGKAINTNGKTVSWVNGSSSSSRCYGAVS